MKIDIIIPNFNSSKLVSSNLRSVIIALKNYKGRIIVVDDGSTEEERKVLKTVIEEYKKDSPVPIDLIQHESNKGFSSAVNTGVRASSADYVVLLNSDVSPSEEFLASPLEHHRKNEKLFGVGCMDESIEGDSTVLRGRGVGKWSRGMLVHSKGEIDRQDTLWISGGSSVFRREMYMQLRGMDEIFNPFYWEDIDLSYRAQKNGYEVLFDNASKVIHMHDEGSIKKHFKKEHINAVVYRNQFIFHWKNISDTDLLFFHLFWLPFHMLGALKRGDKQFFVGLFLAIGKIPLIINKRIKQKKLYKVTDKSVINNFR